MSDLRPEAYDPAKHYRPLASWWEARGDKCLPADVLPPTGTVVTRDGAPIAACIVWLTNAKAAHIAFPVTAPGLKPREALRALTVCVEGSIEIARKAGCTMIWGSAENRGVDRIFQRAGLIRTTPLHSYFMLLDPAVSHDMLVGEDFDNERKHP